MTIRKIRSYNKCATGNICVGDSILFEESVFGGSWKSPKHIGTRRIAAKVIKDSYGVAKQQHTFTLKILGSDGYDKLRCGEIVRRKGRNVYRNGVLRQERNEVDRQASLEDKYERGAIARSAANERRMGSESI